MGIRCSRKRAARLTRKAGFVGIHRRRHRGITHSSSNRQPAPDLVERRSAQDARNRLWVADMTEHATDEGKLYLASISDAFSRMVVGWSMGTHPAADLAVATVNMAVWSRGPAPGVSHDSDHGAQHAAMAFGRTLVALPKRRVFSA